MESKPHLDAIKQWVDEYEQLQAVGDEIFSQSELTLLQVDMLHKGKKLNASFRANMQYEDRRVAEIRASSRNAGRHVQANYGEQYEEATSILEKQVTPSCSALEQAVAATISALKERLSRCISSEMTAQLPLAE